MPGWLTVIDADGSAAQRTGERQATDADRAARRLAVRSLAQFDVMAVERLLLHAWLAG
jgi:hypothetical protein